MAKPKNLETWGRATARKRYAEGGPIDPTNRRTKGFGTEITGGNSPSGGGPSVYMRRAPANAAEDSAMARGLSDLHVAKYGMTPAARLRSMGVDVPEKRGGRIKSKRK